MHSARSTLAGKVTIVLLILAMILVPVVLFTAPTTAKKGSSSSSTVTCNDPGKGLGLGLPHWYRGLCSEGTSLDLSGMEIGTIITIIVLNIVDILLHVIGIVTVLYIIRAGFMYMIATGNSSKQAAAITSLTNAITGLSIAALSSVIVGFVSANISGKAQKDSYGLQTASFGDIVQNALNSAYFFAGAISIIILIVAGLIYATSAGNSQNVKKAQSAMIGAIVGLVIVIFAYAITNFVLGIVE